MFEKENQKKLDTTGNPWLASFRKRFVHVYTRCIYTGFEEAKFCFRWGLALYSLTFIYWLSAPVPGGVLKSVPFKKKQQQ